MTCSSPRNAWLYDDGGERAISFKPPTGRVAALSSPVELPCRKCACCRTDESLVWSVRAYHEAAMHQKNSMVTLTFRDEDCPPSIDKKHLQDFFKRLRHTAQFRYIACGEYGGLTRRPHYHVIFFGQDWLEGASQSPSGSFSSPFLSKAWPFGFNDVVPCSLASIMYVCGYAHKKVGDPDTFKTQSNGGRSGQGGIGRGWVDAYADDLRRTGEVVIEGQKFPIPKRYLQWEPEFLAEQVLEREKYARTKRVTPMAREAARLIAEMRMREAKIKETRR